MEKYIQLTADANCIDEAFSFVEGELESLPGISRKEVLKFHMLVDEIFTNITKYAYEEKGRPIMISFSYDEEEKKVRLIFRDEGREYDPTEEEMLYNNIDKVEKKGMPEKGKVHKRRSAGQNLQALYTPCNYGEYRFCHPWNNGAQDSSEKGCNFRGITV